MQGVVIQGPTDYCRDILPDYKDIDNVIVSTWEGEPEENIDFIISLDIPIIQSPKPTIPGHLNVNMQAMSSYAGVDILKTLGVTEVLKIRNDIKVSNITKFLEVLKGDKLSFLALAKEGVRTDLAYSLGYMHYSHDYPVDLIVYGDVDEVGKAFNFQVPPGLAAPPEAIIMYNWCIENNIEFNLNYEYLLNQGVSFFMDKCLENNIQLDWVKRGFDIVETHKNKTYYNY